MNSKEIKWLINRALSEYELCCIDFAKLKQLFEMYASYAEEIGEIEYAKNLRNSVREI